MATEEFYQANITANLSADERSSLMDHCKELVRKAGGTVREDMSHFFGHIGFTFPNGVENPIKGDDEKFKGKICSRFLGLGWGGTRISFNIMAALDACFSAIRWQANLVMML